MLDRGEQSPPTKSPDHYLTHEPRHPGCEVCQRVKLTGRKCFNKSEHPDWRNSDILVAIATNFGDLITADPLSSGGQEDVEGADYAAVFKDGGTGCLDCHPTASTKTEEAVEALQMLVGSVEEVKNFYTDAGSAFNTAANRLGWRRPTTPPGRPQISGIAERAVK